MSQHHPSINMLAEYCAGTLGMAEALSISAHLHYCHSCRCQVENLNRLNGTLLSDENFSQAFQEPSAATAHTAVNHGEQSIDSLLQSTLNRIDALDNHSSSETTLSGVPIQQASIANKIRKDLPPVIAKLIVKPRFLRWKKLSPAMEAAKLSAGQNECEVSLIKIKAGGRVLEHDHRGNEYTVVLRGAFSDQDGIYSAGDFIHRKPNEIHAPCATADADCLCLTVVDAPLKFTGLIGCLINPFMKLQPS